MSLSIKKNDTVMVIIGKEKGKTGKVLNILRDQDRLLVEKLNMVKRHTKPNPRTNPQGGIIQKEASIHISNVMFYCGKCSKPVRLGAKLLKDGKKVRICRKCGEVVDKA